MKILSLISTLLLFLVIFVSCNSEEKELYDSSKVKNTIDAYKHYIEKYPDGKYYDEINDSIKSKEEEEEFTAIKDQKYSHLYREFLDKYPNSKYKKEAEDSLYSLEAEGAFQMATVSGRLKSIRKVIEEYPETHAAKKAQAFVDEIDNFGKSGTLYDNRDKKEYKWVRIGDQFWMAENLAYDEGYNCSTYEDDTANVREYGYLYSYKIAKKVCPNGWHLPSKKEFKEMLDTLTDNDSELFDKLTSTEENSFNLLLGGWRSDVGKFYGKDGLADYWTSTEKTGEYAWGLHVYAEKKSVKFEGFNKKTYGFSVRCVAESPNK